MKAPFIVYSLPRSRSFWISRFLSYADWECGHDELRHVRSMDDIKSWFAQPNIGTCETYAAPWWRLVQRLRPDLRTVVVRRPVADVVESLMRLPVGFDRAAITKRMSYLDHKLDQIEHRVPDVLSIRYDDLATPMHCATLFEWCLPHRHDKTWWATMALLNLQTNLGATIRYMAAHAPQLEKAQKIARHAVLVGMALRVPPAMDGLTIQEEPFETFLRDGATLFGRHLVEVGEAPDNFMRKNLPLMREADRLGMMQIMTARSNGRMFGYHMVTVGPSLEHFEKSALGATLFAAPECPGLGLRLARASLAALAAKGASEAFVRAGIRGSGPRLGAMWERLGAEEYGQMYRFDLKAA